MQISIRVLPHATHVLNITFKSIYPINHSSWHAGEAPARAVILNEAKAVMVLL